MKKFAALLVVLSLGVFAVGCEQPKQKPVTPVPGAPLGESEKPATPPADEKPATPPAETK